MTRPEIPHTSNARDGLGPTRQNNSVLGAFGIGSKKNGGVADPADQFSCRPLSESGDDVFFLLFFLKGTDNPQWSIGKKKKVGKNSKGEKKKSKGEKKNLHKKT